MACQSSAMLLLLQSASASSPSCRRITAAAAAAAAAPAAAAAAGVDRREMMMKMMMMMGMVGAVDLGLGKNVAAVQQSLLAGRIPGLSTADENGLRTYKRPDEKSGGHGVGWSPMIPYSFKVPQDWQEVPVSIADLGGTEIDLRFLSPEEGSLSVVVAPVQRFSDGFDDNAKIEEIGPPEKVIYAFGPELTGNNVEGRVKDMEVKQHNGRTYYEYELDPHILITATAAGNRLYLMTLTANGRQWRKHASDLKLIQDSFRVL